MNEEIKNDATEELVKPVTVAVPEGDKKFVQTEKEIGGTEVASS